MKPFPIPVRITGPGSQTDDGEELQYLAMPREMNTFRMPQVPDAAPPSALRGIAGRARGVSAASSSAGTWSRRRRRPHAATWRVSPQRR